MPSKSYFNKYVLPVEAVEEAGNNGTDRVFTICPGSVFNLLLSPNLDVSLGLSNGSATFDDCDWAEQSIGKASVLHKWTCLLLVILYYYYQDIYYITIGAINLILLREKSVVDDNMAIDPNLAADPHNIGSGESMLKLEMKLEMENVFNS
eukprot:10200357-Ditylum_brightwellii.AAC.1